MERRPFGRTGLEISVVGFGTWAAGGDFNTISMGPADDDDSVAAIHEALGRGVNWIDTAPGYGLGHAEEIVARALRGMAEPPLVFSKLGFVWNGQGELTVDITPASVRKQVEASLRRLEVDAIDLIQIHWLEPENDPDIEDCWTTLAELKQAGKLRHLGVSNLSVEQMERAAAIAPVETVQPPYSLLERGIENDVMPYCIERDIGVIVYSPMQSGLLTGRMTRERVESLPESDARLYDPNFLEPRLTHNLKVADGLGELAQAWSMSTGAAAVAWTLAKPGVAGAIVGFRRAAQVENVLGDWDLLLSGEQVAALEAL